MLFSRVKMFYFNKTEQKYVDRGIGNIHLKSINNGEKTQLIVRADTSLGKQFYFCFCDPFSRLFSDFIGNILLNINLNKQVPIKKAGKKDVSLLCISNPPIPKIETTEPVQFLFKVNTEEDAEELFKTLNDSKK